MSSIGDELEQLAALRDRGVLTDAEFAEQKARLLGTSAPAAEAAPTAASDPPAAAEPSPAPKRAAPKATVTDHATGAKPAGLSLPPALRKLSGKAWAAIAAVAAIAVAATVSGGGDKRAASQGASFRDPNGAQVDLSSRSASDDLDEQTVEATLLKHRNGDPKNYRFTSVEIGPGKTAGYLEQSRYGVPANGTYHIVRVTYVENFSGGDWNNPSAYIHDLVQTYAAFRNDLGSWTLESASQAGDKDELRGAYVNQ